MLGFVCHSLNFLNYGKKLLKILKQPKSLLSAEFIFLKKGYKKGAFSNYLESGFNFFTSI